MTNNVLMVTFFSVFEGDGLSFGWNNIKIVILFRINSFAGPTGMSDYLKNVVVLL